jgi:hypothetical protein
MYITAENTTPHAPQDSHDNTCPGTHHQEPSCLHHCRVYYTAFTPRRTR